jgi:hypothetical protein
MNNYTTIFDEFRLIVKDFVSYLQKEMVEKFSRQELKDYILANKRLNEEKLGKIGEKR